MLGVLKSHPFLVRAGLIGLAAGALLGFFPNPLSPFTRALLAWDALALFFVTSLLWAKRRVTPEMMQASAKEQDEGRAIMLWLCVLAAGMSVLAIAREIIAARTDGPHAAVQTALAFSTVALSWTFTHVTFASHYAHEFYAPDAGGGTREGLLFPGGEKPDFFDFLHFALVIGVANQTADVQITSRKIRRTATMHGLVAFLFNTVVLAMAINFAASLFG
ncbi:MAG: DUF1345 domain-containing protein [Caulobacterales bacterium]